MENERVTILLGAPLAAETRALAAEQDISPGQLIRDLLAKEVTRRRKARPPVRADERLVAPLRARLAPDLAEAPTWPDLALRLAGKGYELREAGGGLALHDRRTGRRICKASELGFSYSRLMRRLDAPFPGHSHTWLFDRMCRDGVEEDDDQIVLLDDE